MTIAQIQDNDRKERFVATAGQTVFPYDFPIYAATDLQVRRERSGVITTLTYGADYSVTGAQNQTGGNVVLTAGATLNDIIVILSNMPSARTGQFVNGGDLTAAALEAEFNRNRILIQVRALLDSGDARLGPRGLDGLPKAQALYGKHFIGAPEKSSYNLFSQNAWYVGKLAGNGKLPTLRRLIDNQQEFIAAFEEIIRRPGNAQEEVLRELAVRCLAA
jgi:hypothetical protein